MPPTRVPRCGALVVVVAAPEPRVPCLRRGRVPASATASGVRVVDVPASREPWRPRPSRACGRARRPSAAVVCPRRWSRVPASHEPRPRARDEGAAAPPSRVPPSRRGGVFVTRERCARVDRAAVVCSRRACRRARVECAALWRPRRACRRARAQSAVAVCLRRGSRRARAEGAARPRLRRSSRRALDEGAVRWCRGRRVRMVDVPSPSVPH
nr:MAG TPA: hypothetical protein [Caudoviricetes sp.]